VTDPAGLADIVALDSDIARVERDFYHVFAAESASVVESLVGRARETGNPALLARSICLQCRALIARGQHAVAAVLAREGLAAFASLTDSAAWANLAARAELLRTGGCALLKLGRSGEALPLLQDAVTTAELAVARPLRTTDDERRSQHVLIRSLSNIGSALLAVREIDTAIAMYERIPAVPEPGADDPGLIDDLLLARWNWIDALHQRVRRSRAAGDRDRAEADLVTALRLLEGVSERVTAGPEVSSPITGYGRQGYYASLGRHLLLAERPDEAFEMFERQIEAISAEPDSGMYDWVLGIAHAGMAQAALAQDAPQEALRHTALALARFERHDEVEERAPVLLVRAMALRSLGEFEDAYNELEGYHALRARVEAEAAQQYAGHVTAKLGLERARAETESHRRIAATLETLGRIGQEITANLDAEAVVRILSRYVGTLLAARSFSIWLLDDAGRELRSAFGVEDGQAVSAAPLPLDHAQSWIARAVRERQDIVAALPPDQAPATLIPGTPFMPFAIFAPLIVGDRALGALSIQTDRPDAFGDNERSILRTLCTYGAIALDNAAAYRELRRTVSALQGTQNELSMRTAEFERLSLTDQLTGVPNRRHFMERATIEIAEAQRNASALAVAMLDIDHFKDVNDRYGHAAGDVALAQIALIAKEGLRSGDFLARVGGEEFALLLPGAGPTEALAIAERMRAAIERMTIRFDGFELRVTASFGVANFKSGDQTIDDAFSRADSALYRSKQTGRNRVTGDP